MKTRYKFLIGFLVLGVGTALLGVGPDRVISLTRVVESKLPVETLDKSIRNLNNWALWHFDLIETKALNLQGEPYPMRDQTAQTGEWIRMKFEPVGKEWKRFQMDAEIAEYAPKKRLQVRYVSDSKGKLSKLFSNLVWKIELEPQSSGTLVKTEIRGITNGWRARLFGRIAERILMNQVLWVNAQKLADLRQPLDLNPLPQSQQ